MPWRGGAQVPLLRCPNTDTLRGCPFAAVFFGSGRLTSPSWSARLKVPVNVDPSGRPMLTWSESSSSSSSASLASSSARSSGVSFGIVVLAGGWVGLVDDLVGAGLLWLAELLARDEAPEHVVDGFHAGIIACERMDPLCWRGCEPAWRFGASFAGDDYGPERSPRAKDPREYWAGRARWLVDEASTQAKGK